MYLKRISYKVSFLSLYLFALMACSNDNNDIVEGINLEKKKEGCIVIVPDIQYYTNNSDRFVYLNSIVGYINNEYSNGNVSLCLQVGDLTYQNETYQYKNAYNHFFSKIHHNIPLVYCLGNHDYGEGGLSQKRMSNVPNYLNPIKSFSMANTLYENYGRYVSIGGKEYAIVDLEFAPRNEALEWADKVIKENSTKRIIILTHAFLNNDGVIFDATDSSCDNKYSQKYYTMGGDYLNDSREIFDKIIYQNSNVCMVICGHCVSDNFIEYTIKKNVIGADVHCVMVNYQHYENGGAGFLGLLYYNQDHFRLRSFSTYSNNYGNIDINFDII